jgi:hypothetical protein
MRYDIGDGVRGDWFSGKAKGANQVAVVILGSAVRCHDMNESDNDTT